MNSVEAFHALAKRRFELNLDAEPSFLLSHFRDGMFRMYISMAQTLFPGLANCHLCDMTVGSSRVFFPNPLLPAARLYLQSFFTRRENVRDVMQWCVEGVLKGKCG